MATQLRLIYMQTHCANLLATLKLIREEKEKAASLELARRARIKSLLVSTYRQVATQGQTLGARNAVADSGYGLRLRRSDLPMNGTHWEKEVQERSHPVTRFIHLGGNQANGGRARRAAQGGNVYLSNQFLERPRSRIRLAYVYHHLQGVSTAKQLAKCGSHWRLR